MSKEKLQTRGIMGFEKEVNKREWTNCFVKFSLNSELSYSQKNRVLSQFLQNDRNNQFLFEVIMVYGLIIETE